MIRSLETERMWARPVRLEDAEQVQRLFPQWEIVKHLDAIVPWPYPPDGAPRFRLRVAAGRDLRADGGRVARLSCTKVTHFGPLLVDNTAGSLSHAVLVAGTG